MKLKIVILGSLITSIAACSKGSEVKVDPGAVKPTPVNTKSGADLAIMGTWQAPTIDQGGLKFDATYKFEDGRVTYTSSCSFKDKTASAEATAKAVIDGTNIEILEDSAKPATLDLGEGATMDCGIKIDKSKLPYEIRDGKLYLIDNGDSQLVADKKL